VARTLNHLFWHTGQRAVEALEALDPDSLTPKQALEWIYRLKTLM
jgi:hypothetical protein